MNNLYTKEAIELYKETHYICDKLYKPEVGCIACKYMTSHRCKTACLAEKYEIIDIKKLQPLDVNDYVENNNTCILVNNVCKENRASNCVLCLLEILLKDKNVKIIKKGDL